MKELLRTYKKIKLVPAWGQLELSPSGVPVVLEDSHAFIVRVHAVPTTTSLMQALDVVELLKFVYNVNPYLSIRVTPLRDRVKCDQATIRKTIDSYGFKLKAISCRYNFKEAAVKNVPIHQYNLVDQLRSLANDLRFQVHFLKTFFKF